MPPSWCAARTASARWGRGTSSRASSSPIWVSRRSSPRSASPRSPAPGGHTRSSTPERRTGLSWESPRWSTKATAGRAMPRPAPSTVTTWPRCSPVGPSRRHDRTEGKQPKSGDHGTGGLGGAVGGSELSPTWIGDRRQQSRTGTDNDHDDRQGRLLMGALPFESVEELQAVLGRYAYLADRGLATAVWLSLALNKPLLLEGEAGVGKTEVAKVLSELLDRRLVRLQCYEGIDASQALYEWDYSRQLIAVRAAQLGEHEADLFGPDFLVERPLLAAIRAGSQAVLLIDELDRADDEFEAFLLEVLSEFAVTIPEIGRVAAERPPAVIITSNRTRELHDALKRRCLYHWIDHPSVEREVDIVRVRAPEVPEVLARQVARAVARLRAMDVAKRPGVAETIDWSQALAFLGAERLEPDTASATLGALVKDHEDLELVRAKLDEVLEPE